MNLKTRSDTMSKQIKKLEKEIIELEFLKESTIPYDATNEEEFKHKIKIYLSEVKKIEEKSVTNFISAFKEAKKNKDSNNRVINKHQLNDKIKKNLSVVQTNRFF